MNIKTLACFLLLLSSLACNKYLDKKSLQTQFVPDSLEDLQALLNNNTIYSNGPCLAEICADNYYLTNTSWDRLFVFIPDNCMNYLWDKSALPNDGSWIFPYQAPIYYSNIVLDHLALINKDLNVVEYNRLKGTALFIRAFAFYELAQVYCKPFSSTSNADLGIVLRNTSNINEVSKRATVSQTYEKILEDMKSALEMLPETSEFPTRPTKLAVYGALARIYLSMRNYELAEKYADLLLNKYNKLLDFNSLVPVKSPPIRTFNEEVIFHNVAQSSSIMSATYARIDTLLYESYSSSDLRKTVFFRPNSGSNIGSFSFRGSYNGNGSINSVFSGITTGETYLIRSECYARRNEISLALSDLNTLLEKRWKKSEWSAITASSQEELLNIVLAERRKELAFRGQRWTDLRRLNLENANISLSRTIHDKIYSLPPNDSRWVSLIPFDVINRSGIEQNPR